MKRLFFFARIMLALLFPFAGNAQYTLVQPANADVLVTMNPLVPTVEGMNVAFAYYYDPLIAASICNFWNQFFVEVDYGAHNTGNINVVDVNCGAAVSVHITPPRRMIKPDVIIGNTNNSSSLDYTAAVAYMNGESTVYIDYYQITFTNPAVFTVSPTPVSTTIIADAYNPHLDVIAEEAVQINGLTYCDKFVVTWNDCNSNIYAEMASISSPPANMSSGSAVLISNDGITPDVAAVQRDVSSATHNVALVTYIEASTGDLELVEYDFDAPGVISSPTLDAGAWGSSAITKPRIDAFDWVSYSTNPSWSSLSQYKVVAEVDSSGFKIIRAYDNLTAALPGYFTASSVVDVTSIGTYSVYSSGYNHYSPCVAANTSITLVGVFDEYVVSHYTKLNTVTNDAFVLMEPFGWSNPWDIETVPSLGQYYYLVNTNYPADMGNSEGPNAIANTSNLSNSNNIIHAWAVNDPDYDVYFKMVATSTSGYSYRSTPTKITTNDVTDKATTYPNPTSNDITIRDASGRYIADTYEIVDMLGRVSQKGKLAAGKPVNLDVKALVPGVYTVKLYKNGITVQNTKFVKQ